MNNKNISNMQNTDLFLRTSSYETNQSLPLHLFFTHYYVLLFRTYFTIHHFHQNFHHFLQLRTNIFRPKIKNCIYELLVPKFQESRKKRFRCHYAQNKGFRGKCSTMERFFSKSHWLTLNRRLCAYVKSYILMHFEPLLKYIPQ